jgi:hypothetical protein
VNHVGGKIPRGVSVDRLAGPLQRLRHYLSAAVQLPLNIAKISRDLDVLVRAAQEQSQRTRPNADYLLFKSLWDAGLKRSVDIVKSEMPDAQVFLDYFEFLEFCLSKARRSGAHLEFGVYSGWTINKLAELRPDVRFDGFDSFHGLPSEWNGHLIKYFDRKGIPPDVRSNVSLHIGTFEETLPGFASSVSGVAFINIDCDIYESTATIFRELGGRITEGCVLVFDEYFCYHSFEQHERRAFAEFLGRSGRTARWIACCGQRAACILD